MPEVAVELLIILLVVIVLVGAVAVGVNRSRRGHVLLKRDDRHEPGGTP